VATGSERDCFSGGLNGPSADGGWLLVDAGTFEDEELWMIRK